MSPRLALSAATLYCCVLLACAAPAQIVTENAGAVSPYTPILRSAMSVAVADRAFDLHWSHQFIISIDPTREFKLSIATSWRSVEFRDASNRTRTANLFGFGDTTLRFKQVIWKNDGIMESTRFAGIAELVAPTGRHDLERRGVELPRGLQLGTGAWVGGIGPAFTLIRDRHRFATDTMFRHSTRAYGVQFGQTIDLNLAYWYRVTPAHFEPDSSVVEVRGVIELLVRYRFRGEVGEQRATDDGFLVRIAPGVQIYTPQKVVLFEANLQLPIHQTIEDTLGKRSWGATFAVKILF